MIQKTRMMILWVAMLAFGAAWAGPNIIWVGCGISRLGYMQDLAAAFKSKTGVQITLQGGGATRGLRDVASGKAQLGGSCRLPLLDVNQHDHVLQSERAIKLFPMGWDALVVIVHPDNQAVENIGRNQLREVLTGKITNWRELGGPDRPIHLYVRQGKISGVGRTLRQQLFDDVNLDFTDTARVKPSSGTIEKAVEKDPDALAVSGISSSRHRKVKMLRLDGVEPTMETLKKGEYGLFRILYLVAPKDYAKEPVLKRFVDFAYSVEGQEVIRKAGTLPYHEGIVLLSKASFHYVHSIDMVEKDGIYTLGGH